MKKNLEANIFLLVCEQDKPETIYADESSIITTATNNSELDKIPKEYFRNVVFLMIGIYNMICEILKDAKLSGVNMETGEFVEIIAQWLAIDNFGEILLKKMGSKTFVFQKKPKKFYHFYKSFNHRENCDKIS